MLLKSHPFKFFFLLVILFPFLLYSENIPKPIAKPKIVEKRYQDFFKAVKEQRWQVAKSIAYDYQNPSLSIYAQWLDITRPGSKHSFDYLVKFLKTNPLWPNELTIKKKIESSITNSTNPSDIIDWFTKNEPLTVKGSIDFMEANFKVGNTANKREMIRDIWVNKNLTYKQQKYFIRMYSKYWTYEDNWKRFDRLMWDGKNVSAKRTLLRLKGEKRLLGNARLALGLRSGNVSSLINKVPKYLLSDPGLIYERMRWRRKAKLDSAEEFLFDPPDNIKNHRSWWINARIVIRRLINKKKYKKAYLLLSNHNLPVNTISGAEAEWLAGWVALTFNKEYQKAMDHFGFMYNNVIHPNSKSKASYWMAKTMKAMKRSSKEYNKWYSISAQYQYSFYSQNASLEFNDFSIKKEPKNITRPMCCEHLFEVLDILKAADQSRRSYPFLKKLLDESNSKNEKAFIYDYASSIDKNFQIKLVKLSAYKSINFSYPEIINQIPPKFVQKNDLALIHAIILQESAFKVDAYSHAGARGLMQLMPYTAKIVAKSLNIKYYRRALRTNPQYNILLGTTYIKQLLDRFNNSLPLALAGYNAGPGRVKIWLKRYGDPRKKEISYVDWIESIPISETRNYTKKVLANYRIYQNIFKSESKSYNYKFLASNL